MDIIISNASNEPIYEQISNQMKKHIITGDLKEGDALPSIRKLAKSLQISVITTKRAYEELEKEGLVNSVRGKGFFVAAQNQAFIKETRLKLIEEQLTKIIKECHLIGVTLDEFIDMATLLFEED